MRISTSQIYQRGLLNLLAQQEKMAKLQDQQSSGLKVQSPSDDPIAATQIELMNQRIDTTNLMQKNRSAAESALSLEEGILSNTMTVMNRLREIQVQSGNASLNFGDRKSLAIEATILLSQLKDYANSKDATDNYLFSGGQSLTQPFSINSTGTMVYQGDNTQRFQSVSQTLQVAINDPGDAVFMQIPNGNGNFAIQQPPVANTGSAIITTGTITSAAAYIPDDYTLAFALNTQGKLVTMITGTSGNILPASGLPDDAPLYQDGSAITFNGIELNVSGEPAAGDSFLITPSKSESVFSTVQRMITNLNRPYGNPAEKAVIASENNQLLAQIDAAATHILGVQSEIGARLNQLESIDKANTNLLEISASIIKQLNEIDAVSIASEFSLQILNLQAAQQSYVRIQGLSLFNYL